MNFFDFELSRNATATPPQSSGQEGTSEPSLNEEVSQVVGQLGKLWGGFRKQSQVALESARKDFSSVVAQAQKEFGKLTAEAETTGSTSRDVPNPENAGPSEKGKGVDNSTITDAQESESTTKEIPSQGDGNRNESQTSSPSPSTNASPFQTLLSRVQSTLPPNISETLERSLPAALKDPSSIHAPSYADLAHYREVLGAEFARVQGVTRAQAEEYAQKSEALLREAGEYLKDAVRVVPPEDGEDGSGTGEADVVFDGMGVGVVVMPPTMTSGSGTKRSAKGKEKGKNVVHQKPTGSRAAALLAQLKRDPEPFKKDPLDDPATRQSYTTWLSTEIETKEGGIESPFCVERVKAALGEKVEGDILRATRNKIVPSEMDSRTFWIRYFFRVQQIEKDEEKRKSLLAASGAGDNDEDFSWEDDDDDEEDVAGDESRKSESLTPVTDSTSKLSNLSTTGGPNSSNDTLQQPQNKASVAAASYPSSLVTSPSNTSPRDSSDGYDVVPPAKSTPANAKSAQAPSPSKDAAKAEAKGEKEKDEESEDSDWE